MSEITTKRGHMRFRGKAIRDLVHEEQIAFADALIDRDADIWKQWVRESERGLAEFMSRSSDKIILRPVQR